MSLNQRGKKVEVKCAVCGVNFMARIADRKRGWAKCCSKSCACKKSNKDTGKYEGYLKSKEENEDCWDIVSVFDDPYYTN